MIDLKGSIKSGAGDFSKWLRVGGEIRKERNDEMDTTPKCLKRLCPFPSSSFIV